jgi:hypothetical protein
MDIKTVLGLLSDLITILGLPFLIYSLFLLINQLRIQAYQSVYQSSIIMDKYHAENPEIRPYIYYGKAIPDEKNVKEFNKVIGSVEMLAAFYEHVLAQMPNMSKDKKKGWKNWMRQVYETSPAMRYYLDKHEEWHSSELLDIMRKGKDK